MRALCLPQRTRRAKEQITLLAPVMSPLQPRPKLRPKRTTQPHDSPSVQSRPHCRLPHVLNPTAPSFPLNLANERRRVVSCGECDLCGAVGRGIAVSPVRGSGAPSTPPHGTARVVGRTPPSPAALKAYGPGSPSTPIPVLTKEQAEEHILQLFRPMRMCAAVCFVRSGRVGVVVQAGAEGLCVLVCSGATEPIAARARGLDEENRVRRVPLPTQLPARSGHTHCPCLAAPAPAPERRCAQSRLPFPFPLHFLRCFCCPQRQRWRQPFSCGRRIRLCAPSAQRRRSRSPVHCFHTLPTALSPRSTIVSHQNPCPVHSRLRSTPHSAHFQSQTHRTSARAGGARRSGCVGGCTTRSHPRHHQSLCFE